MCHDRIPGATALFAPVAHAAAAFLISRPKAWYRQDESVIVHIKKVLPAVNYATFGRLRAGRPGFSAARDLPDFEMIARNA